ncbi:MAG: acetylxylan esterase [Acidobacteriota bacterium]|nr:acetylxylan esterase [Acidobacteriota bacterium]
MPPNTRRAFLQGAVVAQPLLSQLVNAAPTDESGAERFPGVAYRNYPQCLPDYLRSLAVTARNKRNSELARIVSAKTALERQIWVRQTLFRLIGAFPEKTDLNTQVLGSFERQDYRVEKVVYESRPKLFVSANLYVPSKGQPPFPGVLFQLGHSWNGKAWDSYQRACQGLAKLGFLVLAFDPAGQGERIYYPDSTGVRTRLPGGSDAEHTVPGKQMLLVGATCSEFQLWDAVRSLDYLAQHPLVDPNRLASTGQSGGATLTMLLAAVDDRLKAAAVFSGNTENLACKDFLPPGSTDDAEQNLVGAGPLGFDRWDWLYPLAPKPLLISVSDKDSFGTYSPNYVKNSWEEYRKLARIYQLLGASNALRWADTPLPHGLSYDSRLQMYNWFLRHLKGVSEPIGKEPQVAPEPDTELWVSKNGNMMRSFGGETPFTLTKQRAASLRGTDTPAPLPQLLGVEWPARQRSRMSLMKVPSQGGISIEALDISSVAGVNLPAWLFRPEKESSNKSVLLLLHPAGRNASWREDELCQQLAIGGVTVCAADVRGIGDMSPEFSPGAPGYAQSHQTEEDYAWSSLMLGKSLLGQRVTDILAICGALQTGLALRGRQIALAALGKMTAPGLFAAKLTSEISGAYLAGGLSSYGNIIQTENYTHSFANFVPNILAHTDLPELVAGLAPRRVVIAGAVDAKNAPHSESEVHHIYAAALNGGHLELRNQASWTATALNQFWSSI